MGVCLACKAWYRPTGLFHCITVRAVDSERPSARMRLGGVHGRALAWGRSDPASGELRAREGKRERERARARARARASKRERERESEREREKERENERASERERERLRPRVASPHAKKSARRPACRALHDVRNSVRPISTVAAVAASRPPGRRGGANGDEAERPGRPRGNPQTSLMKRAVASRMKSTLLNSA